MVFDLTYFIKHVLIILGMIVIYSGLKILNRYDDLETEQKTDIEFFMILSAIGITILGISLY